MWKTKWTMRVVAVAIARTEVKLIGNCSTSAPEDSSAGVVAVSERRWSSEANESSPCSL